MRTPIDWGLVFATLALVFATMALAVYTRALATLTGQLVSVEKKRDEREAGDKRRSEIQRCLRLVEWLRDVEPLDFVSQLRNGVIPQPTAEHILDLAVLAPRYIEDPDTRQHLRELRGWIDLLRTGGNIGDNETLIMNQLRSVQGRINWSITRWRDELEEIQ